MGNAVVITAALQVVYAVGIFLHIFLVGVTFENKVYVTIRQGRIVVRLHLIIRNGDRFAAGIAVVEQIDNKVCAFFPKGFRLCLHKAGQIAACEEVHIFHLFSGDGGVAIADGTDDADLHLPQIYHSGAFAVGCLLVGLCIINIDSKQRKLCQSFICNNRLFAPIVFVVAQCHSRKAHLVHPIGHDQTLGQIGLRSTLPHITGT